MKENAREWYLENSWNEDKMEQTKESVSKLLEEVNMDGRGSEENIIPQVPTK